MRPSCVIHQVLTGNKQEEAMKTDWRRTNIFYPRFEHDGKALNVTIDNGSGVLG